jgi:non-canonical purine NTP pyrophosphatase (RdgB/HAM1 family)
MALYYLGGNKNKFAEMQAILPDLEMLDIDLPEIQEIDAKKIGEVKLKDAQAHHQGEFIVEDTSLYFEGLNGLPGPLIKWFMKTIDNSGLYKIAQAFGNFKVQAKTIIGYSKNAGETEFFEGVMNGTVVEPRGTGFGWDPIFLPDGQTQTFAEMSQDLKNSMSMRAMAVQQLKKYLSK